MLIKRIRIFYKFLLILIFLSAVPLLIIGWRLININRLGLQDVILELHTNQAISIAESVELFMRNLREKVKFVISSQGESSLIDWEVSQRMIKSMIVSSEEFLTVSTVTKEGKEFTKVYHPDLEGKVKLENRAEDEALKTAIRTGKFSTSSLYYVDGVPRINLVYPYAKNIYMFIEASLERLYEKVKRTTIGKTGYAYIIDKNGTVVMHQDESKVLNAVEPNVIPILREVLTRKLVGSKEYVDNEGKTIIGAYAPVAALNWSVIIQQDKDEAYLSVRKMRQDAVMLLVIAVIAACIIGYLLTQNMTGPILRLTGAARGIAKGDFNTGSIAEWYSKIRLRDELADLAYTFILMAQQLKRYSDMQADKMNAILFSIADGIIMTDYSGKIILSNRRAKELLGIDRSERMENRNISEIIKREEIALSLKEARETKENIIKEIDISSEEESEENPITFIRTDTGMVSHSESGEELGTVTVIRDITLEKEIEQMKDDFVHSITHDLRSPMTSIRGFLEFLIDGSAGEINEQQKEFLEIIDKSSNRLLSMINDILDVAKMESGSMPLDLTEADIFEVSQSVVNSLRSEAQRDNISLQVVKETDIKTINMDKNLIYRVITNLVSNALKFTPADGQVRVVLTDKEDKIQVSVEDTGEGMPEEYLDKIFDKFEQVKGSKGKRRGTGLGLTIVKRVIESHNGKVWVESELTKGSKFIFWIPRGLDKVNT